ncbi:nucleoside deaminase [Legionella pneumophila serogroup 1]|nr:nucleoside deaminase [Legionella pneumophila]MDW9166202.1 nucleoside deaminase [Legionella pneumophila subsp. fraseri]MDX1845267.1 nucleoside deaminase [Legionella pneumophila subsp. fraseri]
MDFIKCTIEMARENVENGGRPFACLIVQNGKVLAEATNTVAQTHDPTAHAEVNAIRIATAKLGCDCLHLKIVLLHTSFKEEELILFIIT